MTRKGQGCSKGGTEAITCVDDGAIQLEEGDEGNSDVVEGWWVCCVGRRKVAVGRCHDGVGSAESSADMSLD